MIEIIKATIAGLLAGVFFSLIGLPIPAPPVFAGIAGIIGIWLGFLIVGVING